MSASEGCSKEGSTSDGYPCRYACCPARTTAAGKAAEAATLPRHRVTAGGMVRESYMLEDTSRYYKDCPDDVATDRKSIGEKGAAGGGGLKSLLSAGGGGGMAGSSGGPPPPPSGGGRAASPPNHWQMTSPHEKELKKWRDLEPACLNGAAEVWRERGDKRERVVTPVSLEEPSLSPPTLHPRRSVRSETPDDDSVSFHETLGRELR